MLVLLTATEIARLKDPGDSFPSGSLGLRLSPLLVSRTIQ